VSFIAIEDGSLSFGHKRIFSGVNLQISKHDRIALAGENGSGKSCLAQVLTGALELDSGKLTRSRKLQIGYMPQTFPADLLDAPVRQVLLEVLPASEREYSEWKVDLALESLGVTEGFKEIFPSDLSGGWQRLVLLLRATMNDIDFLILDEPTNHLDLGKIFRLERWLTESLSCAYLMISHDRELMDNCCNRTLIIREDGLHDFAAPFSTARAELLQTDAQAHKESKKDEKAIRGLEASAKRLLIWSNTKGINPAMAKRAKGVQSRADQRRKNQRTPYKPRRRDIALGDSTIRARSALRIENHDVVAPDGRTLFHIKRLVVQRGDRIAILGLNGSGKSVFIQGIMQAYANYETAYESGGGTRLVFNPQVRVGYLDQHLTQLPGDRVLIDFLREDLGFDRTQSTRWLAQIGTPVNEQTKIIRRLSRGEQARLCFMVLRAQNANFFVLDEPTNHLDISGQETLEEILAADDRTCVFVTHDRRMLRSVPNRYLEIDRGRLREVDDPENFLQKVWEQAEVEAGQVSHRGPGF
jgi:ATPase subunit of ABC transporter with duplicated ATPase domains